MSKTRQPKIAVLGSVNMDIVINCDALPLPGQTILANHSREYCGGKGANQAIAASRAGGEVEFIGAVGDDPFADRLVGNLVSEGIGSGCLKRIDDFASGTAVIAVESSGQNSIVVVPNANGKVTVDDVDAAEYVIAKSDILLVQLEIPVASVQRGVRLAKKHGVKVVLDPAPAVRSLPKECFEVDLLCPNETEAAELTGLPVETVDQAETAAGRLLSFGAKNVAITLAEKGTLLVNDRGSKLIPAFEVDAVDSTAAGDAFAGVLAVYWSRLDDLEAATEFGNAAGALAASRMGAQSSIASRGEIESLRARR